MDEQDDLLHLIAKNAPPARPAVVDGAVSVDAAALLGRAERAAHALLDGSKSMRGRRVALLLPPSVTFLVSLFGAWRAGATVVVLSPLHPPAESGWFCDRANVDTIVFHPDYAKHAAPLAMSGRRMIDGTLIDQGHALGSLPTTSGEDDALVLFTSGTTARPKGARITHRNLATHARLLREAWWWTPDDRLIHALPLHHLHGLGVALLTALSAGAGVELLPKFDPMAVFQAIGSPAVGNSARVPVWMAVPTMIVRALATYDAAGPDVQAQLHRRARALRLVTCGSAALSPTTSDRWLALTGQRPLERFGMTEIGVGTAARLDGERFPGLAGWPLPSVELRVVDEAGVDLPAGKQGELLVRGPSVFPGYDQDDAATQAAFTDGDPKAGFFRTGDAVVLQPDGQLQVLGRLSVDVLKSGGYKISALEIEAVLREHPTIDDVAVVGLPDPEWGDSVTAVVVVRPGEKRDEVVLREFAKERLAPHNVPKRWLFMDSLPRNLVGKVVKPELVQMILDDDAADRTVLT